ncbi:DNA polymerase V [Modicisalibacter ilicicola DSM 19980]|uniref:DNA polymerase V n=1 Tax=Modicisalibacter ilicicola DSM 19980 TaxID=1121942 RepID=A0A1M4YBF5_9GAMM|nr:translesion error-prone DNA polymerase V autoproteolytic subunit [Halomonas ilicicola]SHF02842.1 DNA polymerase V [Halomonas ilicicola DSM 19980]
MGISHVACTPSRNTSITPCQTEHRGASGFPSPADDYREAPLDLNQYLIPRPASTFIMRVTGGHLATAGFHDGDLLIVDRSQTVRAGQWVVAIIDGELTLQQVENQGVRWWLRGGDPRKARLPLDGDDDCRLWGLVSHVIHDCRRAS